MKTISAIVPVFNEEKTVGDVVRALLDSKLFLEVICVESGSTDKSLEVLKYFGKKIILIHFKKRHGKGHALAAGIRKAKAELVFFCDSDLIGLKKEYLEKAINPMLTKDIHGVLAVPKVQSKLFVKEVTVGLTGERIYFRKDLLPYLKRFEKAGFGVEVFLNHVYKDKKVLVVFWPDVKNPYKIEKVSLKEAARGYINESKEVAQEVFRVAGRKALETIKKI